MATLFMLVAVVVVGAFAVGTILNIRRGTAIMRWMQGGLPLLGQRTTVRWIGTTAVELTIKAARTPFEQVTVVVFLEPRDMPWMRAFTRRRGRRDTIIVRGQLTTAPIQELELLDTGSWSGREALPRIDVERWHTRVPTAPGELTLYCDGPASVRRADALDGVTRRAGLAVRRLSVRRNVPHLQLHFDPPSATASASECFEAVRTLAQLALGTDRPASSIRS